MAAYGVETLSDISYSYLHREFQIVYQPIFSSLNQDIVGFESLLRWQQDRRTIYPADFMPTLHSAGLGLATDCWVIREACCQIRHWKENELLNESMPMGINLFCKHLGHALLIEQIESILKATGLSGDSLCLELVMDELMEADSVQLEHMRHLKSLGVKLYIDKFKPTTDTLAWLQDYSVDAVKIAMPEMASMAGEGLQSIDWNMIQKIQAMGIQPIFKRIETAAQVDYLKQHGAHYYAQGFFFAKPLSQRDLTRLLCQQGIKPRASSIMLSEYLAGLNKVSHIANQYLGRSIVKRYWRATQPDQAWLSDSLRYRNRSGYFCSDQDMNLTVQQQQQLQQWVGEFMTHCSRILHDFPGLLTQSDLTAKEQKLMNLLVSSTDFQETSRSLSTAA